jgi:AcrR family transcriptional regulator
VKEAIRHFVIEKAREVFEQKGYTNATIEDIASASGISKPTLYNYFSGKDEIFRRVVELANCEFEQLITPVSNRPESFPEKLDILTYNILNHINKNRGILKIAFHESHMFIEAIDKGEKGGIKQLLKSKEQAITNMKQFFKCGADEGYIRDDLPLDLVAIFYTGILGEFSLGYILGKEKMASMDLHQISDCVTQILTRGIFYKKK